jgi:hypothetical protein
VRTLLGVVAIVTVSKLAGMLCRPCNLLAWDIVASTVNPSNHVGLTCYTLCLSLI